MIRRARLGFVLAVAAAVVGASATIIVTVGADSPPTTVTQPAATRSAPAFAAMDYYDQNCAKCHGPQGSFYGPSLGRDLDDAGLIKVVRDMAQGPAQAPLEEPDVAVETAFHRALMVGTPYLAVTAMEKDKWSGEVMPDSKVTLTVGDKKIEAIVTDWNWTAALPDNTKPADIVITATINGKTTTLHPAVCMYSHTDAILPPDKRAKR